MARLFKFNNPQAQDRLYVNVCRQLNGLVDSDCTYDQVADGFRTVGCESGFIPGMIYYRQTEQFAKRYLDEILTVLRENDAPIPETMNELAWQGFTLVSLDIFAYNGC